MENSIRVYIIAVDVPKVFAFIDNILRANIVGFVLDQKFIIKTLGTNRQYLYKAISLHSDASFKGIINNFRIAEAKKMISEALENGQELNFSQLYKLVGFNSSASFYRIFKSSTGLSPSDYAAQFLEAQKKGMPSIHD